MARQDAWNQLVEVADTAYSEVMRGAFEETEGNLDMTVAELRHEAMEAALQAVFAEPELILGAGIDER